MGAAMDAAIGGAPLPEFESKHRVMIPDQFNSYGELSSALHKAGLETSQLIVGVDFTGSNVQTGAISYGGRCLHDISDRSCPNPYEQVLTIMAKTLYDFDDDHLIPTYGFGDATTCQRRVFSFEKNDKPCKGLPGCIQRYREITRAVNLSGPTSFGPLIRQAIKVVRNTLEYHILLIVADGQVSTGSLQATIDAIVEATYYPLSIVMVGVGDGPWETMSQFDDSLPDRQYDNFQFVEFNRVFTRYSQSKRETAFATHALMEIPEQYLTVKRLGYLDPRRPLPSFSPPPPALNPP